MSIGRKCNVLSAKRSVVQIVAISLPLQCEVGQRSVFPRYIILGIHDSVFLCRPTYLLKSLFVYRTEFDYMSKLLSFSLFGFLLCFEHIDFETINILYDAQTPSLVILGDTIENPYTWFIEIINHHYSLEFITACDSKTSELCSTYITSIYIFI